MHRCRIIGLDIISNHKPRNIFAFSVKFVKQNISCSPFNHIQPKETSEKSAYPVNVICCCRRCCCCVVFTVFVKLFCAIEAPRISQLFFVSLACKLQLSGVSHFFLTVTALSWFLSPSTSVPISKKHCTLRLTIS